MVLIETDYRTPLIFSFLFSTSTPLRRHPPDSFPAEVLRPRDFVVVGSNVKKKKEKGNERKEERETREREEKRKEEGGGNGRLKARQNQAPGYWQSPPSFSDSASLSKEYESLRPHRPPYLGNRARARARPFVFWNTNEGSWHSTATRRAYTLTAAIFLVENTAVWNCSCARTEYGMHRLYRGPRAARKILQMYLKRNIRWSSLLDTVPSELINISRCYDLRIQLYRYIFQASREK